MPKRNPLQLIYVLSVYALALMLISDYSIVAETWKAASRPNIILFLVDDMGWQDTSVPFHTQTTHLDLVKDIAETRNEFESKTQIARDLAQELGEYLTEAKAQMPIDKQTGAMVPLPGLSPKDLQVWTVDPLEKVFRDAPARESSGAVAEHARGEQASFQVVVRSASPISKLGAEVSSFKTKQELGTPLPAAKVRFVGYVPVDRPIQRPPQDQLRQPPADFPDPLLEQLEMDVPANSSQAIWISLDIPTSAEPGSYHASVRIQCELHGRARSCVVPLTIKVYEATVGATRLWVTNWFSMQWRHMDIAPQQGSPEYWRLLRRYARNMADHRQNVALISPLNLASFKAGPADSLEIDFSIFDRWVEIFRQEGVIGRIEGGHIGGRSAGWNSPFVARIRESKNGKIISRSVDPAAPAADQFYKQFFPALVKHLRNQNWLDCYMQHLADEPTVNNAKSYRDLHRLVARYAPELRVIEACHTKDLADSIQIWVPQLNYLHNDYDYYQGRQNLGDEVWIYTCVFPQGEYANRFIEQPLMKTRLLHWLNYRYGITGYLHWGYNHWIDTSPYTHTTRPHGGPPYLPAGDPWIVYPGKDGPIDSIRHEAMRDGICDHELLCLLAEKNPAAARALASQHIKNFDRYDCDIKTFRESRRKLLKLLSPIYERAAHEDLRRK
jgi:hypothetical protein